MLKFASLAATITLSTPATRAAVWRALETVRRWPQVLPDLFDATIAPVGRLEAGGVITTRAKPGGDVIDMSYQVLAVEPLRRLVLAGSARGFRVQTEYLLEDDGEGSEVTLPAQVAPERMLGRMSMMLWRSRHETQIAAALRRRGQAMLTLAKRM